MIWVIAAMQTRPVPLGDSLSLMELYIYILVSLYIVIVVLIQFGETCQKIAFWITFIVFGTLLVVDASMFAKR